MDALPITVTDIAVIAIVVISGLLALAKGFVREVLGVAGWVGAIFATLYGFQYVRPYARDLIAMPILADAAAGLTVFIASLLVLSLVSRYIASHIKASTLNPLDRTLGFLFGLLRGAVIVCLAYLLVDWVMPPAEQPGWLRSARTMPAIEAGANLLKKLVPEDEGRAAPVREPTREKGASGAGGSGPGVEALAAPEPKSAAPDDGAGVSGYNARERSDMERLIETSKDR